MQYHLNDGATLIPVKFAPLPKYEVALTIPVAPKTVAIPARVTSPPEVMRSLSVPAVSAVIVSADGNLIEVLVSPV